jgi:hypothetical protein
MIVRRGKSYFLCSVLTIYNIAWFFSLQAQMYVTGKFEFRALDVPGLLLGFVVFPLINIFMWSNYAKIEWVDYSFAFMLPMLWLLIVPGGSFTNFLFINPLLICMVSSIYLLRFKVFKKQDENNKHLWRKVLLLWVIIIVILWVVVALIPTLPE